MNACARRLAARWPGRALCFALLACGCQRRAASESKPAPAASAPKAPLDRLAPGELAPGEDALFGLVLPQGMTAQGKFKDSGLAVGPMSPEAVANYVRERVEVSHVEIGAARTVFPACRIKQGPSDRLFRIEVIAEGARTRLAVEDVTPLPPPVIEPGLSDAERWRRAGYTPDGKPLDPDAMK